MTVRALIPNDALDLISLRKEALDGAPLAFGSSNEDDRLSVEFAQRALADENQAVFGFYEASKLTGMVGVIRLTKVKERHKADIWGMYVRPHSRRKGAGDALLRAAIQQAEQWNGVSQIHLSVTETAAEAKRLYERAGFQEWGREPRALCWDGTFVDELHMVLKL